MQIFEHGIMIGPLRLHPDDNSGGILVLLKETDLTGHWKKEAAITMEAPKCLAVDWR
jgi:hypothetical protein